MKIKTTPKTETIPYTLETLFCHSANKSSSTTRYISRYCNSKIYTRYTFRILISSSCDADQKYSLSKLNTKKFQKMCFVTFPDIGRSCSESKPKPALYKPRKFVYSRRRYLMGFRASRQLFARKGFQDFTDHLLRTSLVIRDFILQLK